MKKEQKFEVNQYEIRLEKIANVIEKILSGKIQLNNPGLVLRALETLQERVLIAMELDCEIQFQID